MATKDEIRFIQNSLYLVLEKDVADDVNKRIGRLLRQSFLDGARAQRQADVDACDESMNQWYNETAEFLKHRPLVMTEEEVNG